MTPQQIIKDAMLEIGVLQSGEEPSAAEAADCLRRFNDMLVSGELASVNLNHTTAALTDTLPYPDNHKRAFVFNLAVDIGPGMFGVTLKQSTLAIASDSAEKLKNYYQDIPTLRTDDAVHPYYNPNGYFPNAL